MNDPEHLDRALEQLLADRSPREAATQLDEEELRMLRIAQALRGSRVQPADPNFVERLYDSVFPRSRRISRRTAFLSGLGALAAGILAGVGLDHSMQPGGSTAIGKKTGPNNFAGKRWIHVANVADVPPGSIQAFTADHVKGFLINKRGEFQALSRICTHMGCALHFAAAKQDFVCPCHGAEFSLNGDVLSGPGGYYVAEIPPLPKLKVRVQGESVQVWGV